MSAVVEFILPAPGQIAGAQLMAEIAAATEISVPVYSYVPPLTVTIPADVVGDRQAEIQAVIDTHTPEPPMPEDLSRVEFALRFTAAERVAIRTSTDAGVIDVRELNALAERVDLAHSAVVAGVEYLESVGILAEGRVGEILSPTGGES